MTITSQFRRDKDGNKLAKRSNCKGDEYNLVDRISVLPYEVLVSIVSLLSVKEALATSILSRRWKHVWKYMTILNFQDVDFLVGDSFRCFKAQKQELQDQRSRKYVDSVDRVLQQHRGQNVQRFRAFYFLNSSYTSSIDKWIEFAMEKSVQILELQFLVKQFQYTEDNYTFPHKLLGFQGGYSCRYNIGFKSLSVLHFRHVDVTGEVLEYFLSNCPVLERLHVSKAKNLVSLRVVGSSIALKYLVIKDCPDIKSIEICDANIVSYVYKGVWISLLVSNVPLLVEIDIFNRGRDLIDTTRVAFIQLSCCLSRIEILKLNIFGEVYEPNREFPILENLKHLELCVETDYQWSLYHLTSFMKACPCIQRLVLKLDFRTYEQIEVRKDAKCPHHNLKVVEVVGYRGFRCAVEHVEYLIENAVALEKIIIDPVRWWIWSATPGMDRGTRVVHEERKAREHAQQHLKEKVPSTVEFICL